MGEFRALLLIGPTGSGKTPLGDLLERRGLWGRRCLHLDFGASLRRLVAGDTPPPGFDDVDVDIADRALRGGLLLENEHFPLAERVLMERIRAGRLAVSDLLILNGIPRHLGQAEDVGRLVSISDVLFLHCPPDVVRSRVRRNTGGDRTGRVDDSAAAVAGKLRTFGQRTEPLLRYYEGRGVRVHRIEVTTAMTAEQMADKLEKVDPHEAALR